MANCLIRGSHVKTKNDTITPLTTAVNSVQTEFTVSDGTHYNTAVHELQAYIAENWTIEEDKTI